MLPYGTRLPICTAGNAHSREPRRRHKAPFVESYLVESFHTSVGPLVLQLQGTWRDGNDRNGLCRVTSQSAAANECTHDLRSTCLVLSLGCTRVGPGDGAHEADNDLNTEPNVIQQGSSDCRIRVPGTPGPLALNGTAALLKCCDRNGPMSHQSVPTWSCSNDQPCYS